MSTDAVSLPAVHGSEAGTVVLSVNGQERELRMEPRVSLLDAWSEHLGLTGSKGVISAPAPRRDRALTLALTAVAALVLYRALAAYADGVRWIRAAPDDWIASASLSFAGAGIILHVGIGLRWPFAGLRRDAVAQRLPDDLHPALRAKLGEDAGDIGLDGTS